MYDLNSLQPGWGNIVFSDVSINLVDRKTNCPNDDFEDDASILDSFCRTKKGEITQI